MVDSVFMAEVSWPEWQERIAAGAPVFLPVGSTEQHGPHLPLSCDVIIPTAVCERVAKATGGLVAPTLAYGYKSQPRSGGGEAFPGTTSLDASTLVLVLRDVIRNLGVHGVRKLVVVNGHFENSWPIVEGIDLATRELRRDGIDDFIALKIEYSDFVHRSTLDRLFPNGFPGTELEHASLIETSLMLLLRPDLVGHGQSALRRAGEVSDLRPDALLARPRSSLRRARRGAWCRGRERPMADGRPRQFDHRSGPGGVRLKRSAARGGLGQACSLASTA